MSNAWKTAEKRFMQSIILIKNGEPYITTWELSKGFKVEHRYLKGMIKKYYSDFEEFGSITFKRNESFSGKRGGTIEEYELNEEQATYLGMLLKNNKEVVKFKKHLHRLFFKQRKLLNKLLVQKQNAEWFEKRASGKIERRIETDTIQKFVEYAKEQGSTHAEKYYMVISKMENCTVFNLDYVTQKFPNLRDLVNGFALDALKMADHTVARALKEGMTKKMDYKDIYQLAKQRVEIFVSAIGRSPIQEVLLQHQVSLDKKQISNIS